MDICQMVFLSSGIALPPNHYCAMMHYLPMPTLAQLQEEIGVGNVSILFDGREWSLHSACLGMDRTPGARIFYVRKLADCWNREEQIARAHHDRTTVAPTGYRPATHDEGYAFSKAYPDVSNFIAPGSSAIHDDRECVSGVWNYEGRNVLDHATVDDLLDSERRILLVSKWHWIFDL